MCDRERDKGRNLILKLIGFYVGTAAERISRFFSGSVLLCQNSVVGYADAEEPPKSLTLHAAFHIHTMGLSGVRRVVVVVGGGVRFIDY